MSAKPARCLFFDTGCRITIKIFGINIIMERLLHTVHKDEQKVQSALHAGTISSISNVAYSNIASQNRQQEINFKELLDEIIESQKDLNKNDRVEINVNIRHEAAFISDKTHMQLVFHNLISTTIHSQVHATPKPYVYIKIHSHKTGTNILIRNNSIWVKKEVPKIFKMLYKRSQKTEKFGFEMSAVKESVEKLKGSMNVEFKLEEGTEYNIHLPNLCQ